MWAQATAWIMGRVTTQLGPAGPRGMVLPSTSRAASGSRSSAGVVMGLPEAADAIIQTASPSATRP